MRVSVIQQQQCQQGVLQRKTEVKFNAASDGMTASPLLPYSILCTFLDLLQTFFLGVFGM